MKLSKLYTALRAALLLTVCSFSLLAEIARAQTSAEEAAGQIVILKMDMMILPGTGSYLERGIKRAEEQNSKLVVVILNTPGGLLDTSQHMIQAMFKSRVPVMVYVGPSGSTATSAGVFITMAGHVAAMAPGTSIGAAHPVSGDGKNLESDMRAKAENMTVALVRTISEQRGRNVEWAEKAVKESASLTEKEAEKQNVVDFVAQDLDEALKKIKGIEVKLDQGKVTLGDYSKLTREYLELDFKEKTINVLANPNVAALLWLAATTGISIELYNPGLILPGVVGAICLVLALAVSQVIPLNEGAIALLVLGAFMIGAELFVTSGVLGIGGIIAIILGVIYLPDVSQAPDMVVNYEMLVPLAIFLAAIMCAAVYVALKSKRAKMTTGVEGLKGMQGRATTTFTQEGSVFVNGEFWKARAKDGLIEKDCAVEVVKVHPGMVLEVKKI